MLHRLQLGPRSTPGGLQTREEFLLHDDSNGHYYFVQQGDHKKPKKERSIFNDNTKRKQGRVGLQLSNFRNLVFG